MSLPSRGCRVPQHLRQDDRDEQSPAYPGGPVALQLARPSSAHREQTPRQLSHVCLLSPVFPWAWKFVCLV